MFKKDLNMKTRKWMTTTVFASALLWAALSAAVGAYVFTVVFMFIAVAATGGRLWLAYLERNGRS